MDQALGLRSSNLQSPKNNKEHHTAEIGSQRLFVRRAQAFAITLKFDRSFHADTDKIVFIVETGPQPTESLGTKVRFVPTKARNGNHWSAFDLSTNENSLQVSLSSPANAIIGRYLLKVEISHPTGQAESYLLGEFILLFNPWSSEDEVYLPSQTQLQEYIMMDYGFIFKGHENWITPWPWNYGQFEDDIIDICFEILDRNLNFLRNPSKDYSQRNSVMYVCRVVSAMINSNDDSGVLQGNWSEDYSRGVNPLEWNGSVAILRQWHATGGQPVKYGQCWVFAAVMCTVMRCLGVPTRVITNFRSAHNTDGNLTVDMFYDKHAEMMPWERRDKIWNFHVWNECWMTRKDLPSGYDGWQVLDPTPQETSRGIFCCGPASVKAIKEGDIQLAYDTPFVFAEVNADEVIWLQDYGQVTEILSHNTSAIGKKISTKMVGSDKRQDITNFYKYPEGSAEERSVFMKASRILFGSTGSSYPYMERMRTAWFQEKPVKLQLKLAKTPEWEKELPITLPFTHYKDQISDEKLIRLSGVVEIEQTRRKLLVIKDISLELPHLTIEVFGQAVVGKKLRVSISFTNTQDEPLQNCVLVLEGSGLMEGQKTVDLGTLQSGDTMQAEVELIPTKEGARQLQVLVSCTEVKEIKGYKDIFVASASSP